MLKFFNFRCERIRLRDGANCDLTHKLHSKIYNSEDKLSKNLRPEASFLTGLAKTSTSLV